MNTCYMTSRYPPQHFRHISILFRYDLAALIVRFCEHGISRFRNVCYASHGQFYPVIRERLPGNENYTIIKISV